MPGGPSANPGNSHRGHSVIDRYRCHSILATVRFWTFRTMFEPEPNPMFEVQVQQIIEPEPEWRFRFGVRVNPNIGFRTEHFLWSESRTQPERLRHFYYSSYNIHTYIYFMDNYIVCTTTLVRVQVQKDRDSTHSTSTHLPEVPSFSMTCHWSWCVESVNMVKWRGIKV